MLSYNFILFIIIFINIFQISSNKSSSLSLQRNSFSQQKILPRSKIRNDLHRIKQTLEPLRSLYNSRDVYHKYNNMLKTLWTCCPQQRIYMFDIRNNYYVIMGRNDCHNFIRENRTRLTRQCQNNLKLYDPTRGDMGSCDGRLLRNLADKWNFVVELSNYTEQWCIDGLYSMLIYTDINQILPCERAIRQGLRKDPQSYTIYDALSRNILNLYVQNLHNYRNCSDPYFWEKESDEETNTLMTMIEYRR
ncbi:unnamed protein product [Adineta steineri]|uniref:Uncharacterized protein n=1 Tax=Adineta steineri TaxID=433720 RepID=A0A819N8M2_9BILA|nr:unnamed protein product [Adineta steineri]CAF3994562.1 unnamed protein product [Adineta steineri]